MVTSPQLPHRPVVSLIAAFLIGLLLAPSVPAAALGQAPSSVTVGSSTVAFTGGWTLREADSASVFLLHDGESALVSYAELPDDVPPLTDNDVLIEGTIVPVMRDVDGYENFQFAASGDLQDGTRWHSYTLLARGSPFIFLVTGNTESRPGMDVLMTVLAPQERLASVLTAVRDGITVNDQPTAIASVPVDQALGQGAAPATTTAPASPPTSHLTGTGQVISWAEPWTLVADRTLVTPAYDVIFVTDGAVWVVVATGDLAPDAARGLLLGSLGANPGTIQTIDQGAGSTSRYWFDYVPIGASHHGGFTTAAVDPSGSRATLVMYFGPQPRFADGLAQAQGSITIDGTPVFAGVDGQELQSRLLLAIPSGRQTSPSNTTAAAFAPAAS